MYKSYMTLYLYMIMYDHIDGWEEEESILARVWRTTYLDTRLKNDVSRREDEERRVSARGWRTTYLDARIKNDVSRRTDEERRMSTRDEERHISARGWRTPYLGARMKNDVSWREEEERAPGFVVRHPRAEIRRSSSSRRDTSFLIRAPRYVLLHPRAEIRSSFSQPSIYTYIWVYIIIYCQIKPQD